MLLLLSSQTLDWKDRGWVNFVDQPKADAADVGVVEIVGNSTSINFWGILLMEGILDNHLGCIKLCESWDKLPFPQLVVWSFGEDGPKGIIVVYHIPWRMNDWKPTAITHLERKSSEPNLQGIMFQPLIFKGVVYPGFASILWNRLVTWT